MLFGIMLTPGYLVRAALPEVRMEEILIALLLGYLIVLALAGSSRRGACARPCCCPC